MPRARSTKVAPAREVKRFVEVLTLLLVQEKLANAKRPRRNSRRGR